MVLKTLLVSTMLLAAMPAFARQGEPPAGWTIGERKDLAAAAIPLVIVKAVDRAAELAADDARTDRMEKAPLRFATVNEVAVDVATAGRALQLADGGSLQQLRIKAPGATDINLAFAGVKLPHGASLYLYPTDRSYFEGPYVSSDLAAGSRFFTPVVPGDDIIVEIQYPSDQKSGPVVIDAVNAGYRDLFGKEGGPFLKSGSCNNDVICPVGDLYLNEIRSVARYTINGQGLCTGTLMMDADRTFRPWFLTAAHCGISSESVADSIVVYWNFQSPTCGQQGTGSLSQNQSGTAFRARRLDVDMSLIELDALPNPAFNVHYSGWDRSDAPPAASVHIHHPNGDEKAISFNDDLLTKGQSCIRNNTGDTHWIIDDYEDGTTEPGSSGSGVWTPVPLPRLIGFLSGGGASCARLDLGDCYGRFAVAWDGTTAATRLRDWLGAGSQPLMVDGSDPGSLPEAIFSDGFSAPGGLPDAIFSDGFE